MRLAICFSLLAMGDLQGAAEEGIPDKVGVEVHLTKQAHNGSCFGWVRGPVMANLTGEECFKEIGM